MPAMWPPGESHSAILPRSLPLNTRCGLADAAAEQCERRSGCKTEAVTTNECLGAVEVVFVMLVPFRGPLGSSITSHTSLRPREDSQIEGQDEASGQLTSFPLLPRGERLLSTLDPCIMKNDWQLWSRSAAGGPVFGVLSREIPSEDCSL
jgi:hypothetical protein